MITHFALWLIRFVNDGKNRILSQKLFEMAERYNTRPGEMNYYKPEDSDTWNYPYIVETNIN